MKNIRLFHIFPLITLLATLASCSKDEIIFDHELPAFPTRDGYQLLEVIMPQGTAADDRIYIAGAFNGGEEAAVGDPRWQLEHSSAIDAKWGIYLNPADFTQGKTLADGYHFYSTAQREERTLRNGDARHTENPGTGSRSNIYVDRWAAYFDKPLNPDEITHDGHAVFVVDNTGFSDLTMYAWGDAEAFGGWPGIPVTGRVTIDGVEFKYFDTGADNTGLAINLIFSDNGNNQLNDYAVTLDKDYYLELTPDGVREYDPSSNIIHDGFAVFVANKSAWENVFLYMWGDVNDLNGAWPGMSPTGSVNINGVSYLYFDLGEANVGTNEHVILNDGNGTQFDDVVVFPLDRDVYVELSDSGTKEIDPETYTGGSGTETPADPEPAPEETGEKYNIYILDNTGWTDFYVYAWGDKECFGKWPGAKSSSTVTVDGLEYKVFEVTGSGETENLIFHCNDGETQYDAVTITLDKDYHIIADPASATLK